MPVNPATPIGRCGGGRLCALHVPGTKLRRRGFIAGVTPLPAFHRLRGCGRAKCGILPTRPVADVLCTFSHLVAGYSIRSWEPMPRYYFHYRDGSSIFEDDVGEVFADASLAMQHAKKIARELARGGEPTNAAIVVVEGGQHLFEVPLAEQGD
jgi:hypothetical protein